MKKKGTIITTGSRGVLLQCLLAVLSFALAAALCQWKGDVWENKVRYGIYDVFRDSFPDFAPNFVDSRGIPVTYYPLQNGITAGYRYNGTIVAKYAIEYFEQLKENPKDPSLLRHFNHCVQWLDSAITEVQGHALYVFDWQQPWYPGVGKPFTCGMTSGRAMEVFCMAFALDGDSSHLRQCARLARGYTLPVNEGGFTYKEPEGWWFEEIADTGMQTPRILDGHIFALTGLHKYYRQTHDSIAKTFFDSGIRALKAALPRYDRGDGFVYYDALGKLADENYHPLLVEQMQTLYQITGEPIFGELADKWGQPINKPFVYKMVRDGNKSAALLFMVFFFGFWLILYFVVRFTGLGKKISAS